MPSLLMNCKLSLLAVKQITLFILILVVGNYSMSGQQKLGLVTLGVSANAYRGDLNSSLEKWTAIYHFGYKFNAAKKLNGNVNLSIGLINGENFGYTFDDQTSSRSNPNRFFRTPVFMFNYDLQYNLVSWKNLNIFISQGIGLLRYNPQDEFSEDYQNQPNTRSPGETYSNVALILPSQLGLLYLLPNDFGFSFQFGVMNTLTDYLDNISDWGIAEGGDNIFSSRFSFHIPIGTRVNTQPD